MSEEFQGVETFEGFTFEKQADPNAEIAALENQAEITDRYRTLCEAALAAKIGGLLGGLDLLVLGGGILEDEVFGSRVSEKIAAWLASKCAEYGDNFAITTGRFDLEAAENFPLQVTEEMTKAEKKALRAHLQAKGVLPRS